MENNLIRYLEEQDLHSDVSYDVERPAAEGIPDLVVIIHDDDSNVLPIYISSDEEEVENIIVLEDSDEDPEEGRYDGRYGSSLRAEGNEEEEDEDEVAESEEEENEEQWEEAEDADDESEEEEVDMDEFNGPWLWEQEDSDESEDDSSDSEWTSPDSGYSTMTSDEDDREDEDPDVEGIAPEVVLAGREVPEEPDFNIRPPPLDRPPSQNSVLGEEAPSTSGLGTSRDGNREEDLRSFYTNLLCEEVPSTSGLGTSRDGNREEDLRSFYTNLLCEEVPSTSGLGTSREEGQVPSPIGFETPDLWSCFGILPDDEAPSTSGLCTSRKRSREEDEEQEEEHPAQRPRRSSDDGLREEPTPSTSGLNSWTQGGRYWEGIYPRRQEQMAASDGDALVPLTLREEDEDEDLTPPRSTQVFHDEEKGTCSPPTKTRRRSCGAHGTKDRTAVSPESGRKPADHPWRLRHQQSMNSLLLPDLQTRAPTSRRRARPHSRR